MLLSLYVGNNRERELVTVMGMAPPYLVCGPLVSNGSSHIVTTVEEGIQNMSGNETGPSRNENSLALADIFDTITVRTSCTLALTDVMFKYGINEASRI